MEQAAAATMTTGLHIRDVSGQKHFRVPSVSKESTIGELIHGLLGKMGLARNDSNGRPLTYRARLEREGRHLDARERIGESLKEGDAISLHPNVIAGGVTLSPRSPARA
jgi:hypothetical protein